MTRAHWINRVIDRVGDPHTLDGVLLGIACASLVFAGWVLWTGA